MKIQFATKQMTVPERVYSHAEHRINELDPFFRGKPEAAVVFGAEDGKAVVELTIFAGSTIFRVVEKTSDMMVSIDAAVSSVRRQLREMYRLHLPEMKKGYDVILVGRVKAVHTPYAKMDRQYLRALEALGLTETEA